MEPVVSTILPKEGFERIIVVSHTHWDREWYQPFQLYRIKLVAMVDHLLEILSRNPAFHSFTLDGQTVLSEDYLEVKPWREEELRQWVEAGRILVGPWYTMPDEFLSGGETLIRNLLLGRAIAKRLGRCMAIGYCPDSFGHPSQMPQILNGFGIDSFIFSRGLGDEGEELGSEFLWQASDGSQVLAVRQVPGDPVNSGYCNAASLGQMGPEEALAKAEQLIEALRPYARTPYLLFNNGCDHTGPQERIAEVVEELGKRLANGNIKPGSFEDFVRAVRDSGVELATYRGEMRWGRYAPILSGVLSSRMYLKQENERALRLLERTTEPLATLAWLLGAPHPRDMISYAWRLILKNHAHDSICGCGVDEVHREVVARFAQAEEIASGLKGQAGDFIAELIDTSWLPKGSYGLVVFNLSAHARSDVVRVDLPISPRQQSKFTVAAPTVDGDQGSAHAEALGEASTTMTFVARDLPPMGYRCYALAKSKEKLVRRKVSRRAPEIANQYYRIACRNDGTLTIEDRETGRVLEACLVFEDGGDAGDEYNYSPPMEDAVFVSIDGVSKVEVTENAVESRMGIRYDMRLPEKLTKDRSHRSRRLVSYPVLTSISLYADIDRVEFRTMVENRVQDHRLRVLFPTSIRAPSVYAESPFDIVERPLSRSIGTLSLPAGEDWKERPSSTNHHSGFVAVEDEQVGFCLMAPGLPEYEVIATDDGAVVALTLLRSVGWLSRGDIATRPGHAGPAIPTPEAQCPGRHEFQYAIKLYPRSWQEAGIPQAAQEYRSPLQVLPLEGLERHPGSLPPELSFLGISNDKLILTCLKVAEDRDSLVARVYNPTAQTLETRISLWRSFREAYLTRLDEEKVERCQVDGRGAVLLSIAPHRIETIEFTL